MIEKVLKRFAAAFLVISLLASGLSAPASAAARPVPLDRTAWKFMTDPDNVGITEGWYEPAYDDGGWRTDVDAGKPWEASGVDFVGYAWYRYELFVPADQAGIPLTIKLPFIYADDDTYFNGKRIGGMKGAYKFVNLQIRQYTVLPEDINYGGNNVITVRVWGVGTPDYNRYIEFNTAGSGLAAGDYTATFDKFRMMARPAGGSREQEVPISLWDLSDAQKGEAFEIVYRFDPQTLARDGLTFSYSIEDYGNNILLEGSTAIEEDPGDGVCRAVIPVGAEESRLIYLAGRFKLNKEVTAGDGATFEEVRGDDGATLSFPRITNASGNAYTTPDPSNTFKLYKKSYNAGTIKLGASRKNTVNQMMYNVIIVPQNENDAVDVANIRHPEEYTDRLASSGAGAGLRAYDNWVLKENLQAGGLRYLRGNISNPERFEIWPDNLPEGLYGNKWFATDLNSRSYNLTDVICSFDVDVPVDIYIFAENRFVSNAGGPAGLEPEEPAVIAPPSGWEEETTGFTAAFLDSGTARPFKIFSKEFEAGEEVVIPGDKATNTDRAFHSVIIDGAAKDEIADFQSYDGLVWEIKDNLQNGDATYTDRTPTDNHMRWTNISSNLLGKTWISTPVDAKNQKVDDIATFTAPADIKVYLLVDGRANILPWEGTDSENVNYVDYLNFSKRDNTPLPELPATYEDTPYGNLKLVDAIDCSTSLDEEDHPYMESKIGGDGDGDQANKTPGIKADVQVSNILGRPARETMDHSWFGYRLGRGKLEPNKTYLIRFEYPEDKARVFSTDIAAGQHFSSLSWRTGEDVAGDPYGTWPLSGKWQYHDVILPLDEDTQGSGGADDGNAENGVWVFVLNKRSDNGQGYFATYDGGPAIAGIRLYEIDPEVNAPEITLPEGLPQRTLMLDWEREPTQEAEALVDYAKLMGYSAISPTLLKWGSANYGDPVAGYHSLNVSGTNYWIRGIYDPAKPGIVPEALPGEKTTHEKFLDATKGSGINYIPRIEFCGSLDLNTRPETKPMNKNGEPAKANRTPGWVTNILHPDTYDTFKTYLDTQIGAYAEDNPQMTGILWRQRGDAFQISYGAQDIATFCADTGRTSPTGNAAQIAAWASTGAIGAEYEAWWHKKRAEFQGDIAELLNSYGSESEQTLYWFNWDNDKFSLGLMGFSQWGFLGDAAARGAQAYYDLYADRLAMTAGDYIRIMREGDFTGPFPAPTYYNQGADWALWPEVYNGIDDVQVFAPINILPYASDEFINYFQTTEGLAVSNVIEYDEIAQRSINPKYTSAVTQLPGPHSMELELLSYYYGDVTTLTFTTYTYSRGFADAHRRFAQAFRALPAIPGAEVLNTPEDTMVRTYPTANGTYVGVAYKGYENAGLTINIPGMTGAVQVKNLVTGETSDADVDAGGNLTFNVNSGPVELHAYLVTGVTATTAPEAPENLTATVDTDDSIALTWDDSDNTASYTVKRATTAEGPYEVIAENIRLNRYTDKNLAKGVQYYYVAAAVNSAGEGASSNVAAASVEQTAPAVPTGLMAGEDETGIMLSWNPDPNVESYIVERSTTPAGIYTEIAAGVTANSYIDTTAQKGRQYYYRIAAVNSKGSSGPTVPVGFRLPDTELQEAVSIPFTPDYSGYITESSTGSGLGGITKNQYIRIGSTGGDAPLQNKSIVSFDTSNLPAGAAIVSGTLKLKTQSNPSNNPFGDLNLGRLNAGIKGEDGFSGDYALETGDFATTPDAVVFTSDNAGTGIAGKAKDEWVEIGLDAAVLDEYINKDGSTQLMLYFSNKYNANGNKTGRQLQFYAKGSETTPTDPENYPVLEIVYEREAEGGPVIASIRPVSVSTPAGTPPELPGIVTAVYDDGSEEELDVAWDSIDPSAYADEGNFEVQGTVQGTGIRAVATVTVTEPIPPAEADKTELNALIGLADTKVESDYTAETWAAFAAALDTAKSVGADAGATQDEVDDAAAALQAAIEALIAAEPPADEALLSVSAEPETKQGDPVEFVLSMRGMNRLLNAAVEFEVDGAKLEGGNVEALNGFIASDTGSGPVTWTDIGEGKLKGRILLLYMENTRDGLTSAGELDIARILFDAKVLGNVSLKVTSVTAAGLDENEVPVYLASGIKRAEAATTVVKVYSPYDVNHDDAIDQLDLAAAQYYYQSREGDTDWNEAEKADVNGDGVVNMADLIDIILHFAD